MLVVSWSVQAAKSAADCWWLSPADGSRLSRQEDPSNLLVDGLYLMPWLRWLFAARATTCSAWTPTLLSRWGRRLRHSEIPADRRDRCSASTSCVAGVLPWHVVIGMFTRRTRRSSWGVVIVVVLRRRQLSSFALATLGCSSGWSPELQQHPLPCIWSFGGPYCSLGFSCWVAIDRDGAKLLAEHRTVLALWRGQQQEQDGVMTTVGWCGTTVIDVATCTVGSH